MRNFSGATPAAGFDADADGAETHATHAKKHMKRSMEPIFATLSTVRLEQPNIGAPKWPSSATRQRRSDDYWPFHADIHIEKNLASRAQAWGHVDAMQ